MTWARRNDIILCQLVLALASCCSALTVGVLVLQTKSHMFQLSGLAVELCNRGHVVTIYTNEELTGLLSSYVPANLTVSSVGALPHPESHYEYTRDLGPFLDMQADASASALRVLLPQFQQLQAAPDVFLFDVTFPAGQVVARALPETTLCVAVSLGTVYLNELGSEPPLTPAFTLALSADDLRHSFAARLKNTVFRGVLKYGVNALRFFKHRQFWADVSFFSPYPYGYSKPLIASSVAGFDPVPHNRNSLMRFVGPMLPRPYPELASGVRAFLDEARVPVVYVSIGTNAGWTVEWCADVMEAFRLLDGKVLALVSSPDWQVEKFFPKQLPDNVKVVPFVSQLAVLQHPNVACFMTHAGYSSVQEAVFYGVPMLAMPGMLSSDQPTHASRVASLGLGIRALRGVDCTTGQCISSSIRSLLSSSSIRENVRRWSAIFKEAGGPSASADHIERWHRLGYSHLIPPEHDPSIPWLTRSGAEFYLVLLGPLLMIKVIKKLC